MYKKFLRPVLVFFLFFALVLIVKPPSVKANGDPLVMLDEFVVYPNSGSEEWIELLNPNQDSALSLSGWRLVVYQGTEPNYTYRYSQNLSGSVPRGGFLTFATDDGVRLPNEGACLVIFRSESESVYAVKYGNGTCDAGAGEQDASGVNIEQGKSIYYNLDENTWNSASSPTRGWCNPGSGDCPTVSDITNRMTNEGVTTNLGDQTDFSRISGLYFQKSEAGQNIGKITFLTEMNFTDRDALSWMQQLDTKISISQGIISLDADLINNLISTQASLTMYNISLSNPTIRVTNTDGTSGDSNIVSGISYDRSAGTLTFTAAHFTTFTAIEATSSSSSSSPTTSSTSNAPSCPDLAPAYNPHLFQIDTTKNTAKLYFTPVNDHISYYYIAYGYTEGDERFGVQFPFGVYGGVIDYMIGYLAPNTTYYFKVRAGNGCMPGAWSNVLAAKTEGYYKPVQISQTTSEISPSPTKKPSQVKGESTENIIPSETPVPTPINKASQSPSSQKFFFQKIIDFIFGQK